MKNHKLIYILILIISTNLLSAQTINQLNVFGINYKSLQPLLIDELKKTKTVFLTRDTDNYKDFEKAVKEVWDFTEISVLPYGRANEIDLSKESAFEIEGIFIKSDEGTKFNFYLSLSLYYDQTKDENRINPFDLDENTELNYCKIALQPSFKDVAKLTEIYLDKKPNNFRVRKSNAEDYDTITNEVSEIMTDFNYKNFGPGFIKAQLKHVNNQLKLMDKSSNHERTKDKSEIAELANYTLYVPKYAMAKLKMFKTRDEEYHSAEEMFKKYDYDIKVISENELQDKILNSDEIFYYLLYFNNGGIQDLNIVNSVTSDIIYTKSATFAFNLKPNYFASLNKLIKFYNKKKLKK